MTKLHTINEAIDALKKGEIIIVVDDENRENEGDLICLGEYATPQAINYMATHGKGLICTPITKEKAEDLALGEMVMRNTDDHGTNFTVSVDYKHTHTGISAYERSQTILALLDGEAKPTDFKRPGHVFPLIGDAKGVLARQGHTEAALDLARLAGSKQVGVICEILNDDGTMMRLNDLKKFAERDQLKMISIEDLVNYRKKHEKLITREADIRLPAEAGDFRLVGYTENVSGKEHVALIKGEPSEIEAPYVRIHSECLTGDVFGSKRCDCGPQLDQAMAEIEERGSGIILYMRQEGRGIGLINKLKAYELQEQGFDTVEANHKLGFADDLRDYAMSAQMLKDLGVENITLLTNNPAKLEALEEYGITIHERRAIQVQTNGINEKYLNTKRDKMRHFFN